MKPEQFIIDVKNNALKSYYIFSGDNKYVIDRYISFALKCEKWNVLSVEEVYAELSNSSLFKQEDKFLVGRLETGEKGRKELELLKTLHSNIVMLLLSTKQVEDENEIYFSTMAGINHAEIFCKENNISNFPITDCVQEFGLYKTMMELHKLKILQNSLINYRFEDIINLADKPGGELKIFDLDFSDFDNFEEYVMAVKIEKDILTMIRIREIVNKPISDISRISGIENEKMIYLFKKYAVKYTLEELIELFNYIDNLREWLRSGMREGYFRELIILKLIEINRR